jgi:hypothetical protein
MNLIASGACAPNVHVQSEPRIRFCTLDPDVVARGQEYGTWELSRDSLSAENRRQLSIEGSARLGEALNAEACDAIALRMATARTVELLPMAIYPFGAGYYIYQPGGGGREAHSTIVSPSFEIMQHWYATD